MEKTKLLNNRVFFRTILISSVLLGGLLFALDAVFHSGIGDLNRFGKGLEIGLSILIFWVVVTASLRSINRLAKDIPGPKLLMAGVAIAVLGTLLSQFILQVLNWTGKSWAPAPNYKTFLFFGVAGLIASIISLINLRVKDQRLGNILELLFIAAVAVLFFYFAR